MKSFCSKKSIIMFPFLFSLFYIGAVYSAQASIIFVHLGSKLPTYIYDAVKQARLFNDNGVEICLIANQTALQLVEQEFSKGYAVTLISCESLAKSNAHNMFLKNSTLDTKTLDGFWRKTCERFFYLHEYIMQQDLKNVFHLESDNMLYADLLFLLPNFQSYQGIAAVFDHDDRCIPSFMYIAHPQAMTEFVEFIAKNAEKGMTDMAITAFYRKEKSADYIDNLPIVMKEYTDRYILQNLLGQKSRNPGLYCQNSDTFKSIFDGAALGQYLGGVDPMHGSSKPGFINETTIFNPSHFAFEWINDDQGRKVPYAIVGDMKYRINNLHIHSKQLYKFKS